nr:retrovirus-related Pol polyprotein from transposon TNT 1-94 [Tanacetum cinerariifolium]
VSITNPHNKTPYELISGKLPQIGHLKPFGCQVTILNTSNHLGKFKGKADEGYLVGYASNSYTRFKTDTPTGAQATNIIAGNQDDDSDSEYDEQVIVVPSFPSNSFACPSSSNAERYRYLFSQETADILSQAEADIRKNGASAALDSAGKVLSASGYPASSVPADGEKPAGSTEPAGSIPAASTSVSADS